MNTGRMGILRWTKLFLYPMQSDLKTFIDSNPDPRELKRALAVQMVQQGYVYTDIQAVLQVSVGFITKWKQNYEAEGVKGLRLAYQGRKSYLNDLQRQAVIEWLQQKQYWQLLELVEYVDQHYGVVFASKQSYYDLFHEAGISWKKTQKRNPKKDPDLVEKNRKLPIGSKHIKRNWSLAS
ncbi:helix-turn-helix domain-containing protein [Leptolyngbya boryana]|uniref:helix-turn-helix domain-containing protein n=1 Tax=Leptolyngbya boryana TaxID=1184 RepID=UPI0029311FAF|nr:transposase [Leptolyngbya boryana]